MENELLACEEELKTGDSSPAADTSAVYEKLLSDDLLMIGPKGETYDKAFIVEAHRPPKKQTFESVHTSERAFLPLSENLAMITCRTDYGLAGKTFGLRFLRLWQKSGGQWRVLAGSVTVIG